MPHDKEPTWRDLGMKSEEDWIEFKNWQEENEKYVKLQEQVDEVKFKLLNHQYETKSAHKEEEKRETDGRESMDMMHHMFSLLRSMGEMYERDIDRNSSVMAQLEDNRARVEAQAGGLGAMFGAVVGVAGAVNHEDRARLERRMQEKQRESLTRIRGIQEDAKRIMDRFESKMEDRRRR